MWACSLTAKELFIYSGGLAASILLPLSLELSHACVCVTGPPDLSTTQTMMDGSITQATEPNTLRQ